MLQTFPVVWVLIYISAKFMRRVMCSVNTDALESVASDKDVVLFPASVVRDLESELPG